MSEKLWNDKSKNWEIDGEPVTYRVTWISTSDRSEQLREFADVDQGYSFYLDLKKGSGAHAVTWGHMPW